MLTPYLHMLTSQPHLTTEQAEMAMKIILEEGEPHQTSAFLGMLQQRGVKAEEIVGMIEAINKGALPVSISFPVLDIVGTGGDLAQTVNISTGSAILAAACGVPIAKHGGRSVSSRSGSADVLEALGIEIEVPPELLTVSLEEAGIAFMYAPTYHPTFKKIGAIRRALQFPTVMNYLGPLVNPARAEYALIGVSSELLLETMSDVILLLGKTRRTLMFHGCGLDELTTLGKCVAYDIQNGKKTRLVIDPQALGFSDCSLSDLQGGEAQLNASILKDAFQGKESAIADALILNSGAAVWIFGLAATLEEGIETARQALSSGKALSTLEKWQLFSQKLMLRQQFPLEKRCASNRLTKWKREKNRIGKIYRIRENLLNFQ